MGEQQPPKLTRRDFIASSSIAVGAAAIVISGSALVSTKESWGLEVKHLSPEAMSTLIQMSRDIYPHDRLADRYYAIACKNFDKPDLKETIEEGIKILNKLSQTQFGTDYVNIGWEAERTSLLEKIQTTPMFQALRGSLVTGIYNQKEVWPLFGYQGASFEHGGYIDRGFDDIDWL
ncbi:MAG: twin-arginine translocation signal domain-containing protein [Rhizobiales bacterium]|nr:twin-arginine translocation signal domain-containing protein [Hyphomicrobiales bacterium]